MTNTENKHENVSEEAKRLVELIKQKTAMTAYKLEIQKDSQPGLFDSKFGGMPYWDMNKEYPTDAQGVKMILLAQLNFTEAQLDDERLPKQGMLQFFIPSDDDVFGADFDEPDSQSSFRVIYHENIDTSVTKEQIDSLQIPTSEDEYTPVCIEAAVKFIKTTAYMSAECADFDKVFRQVVLEVSATDIGSATAYKYLSEDDNDYLYDELCETGHWVLGYPFFTQYDPREDTSYYDTLLFQMDSDMIDGQDYVIWGDCGVGNFFINSEALAKKDFSKVMYNWDCC